LRTAWLFDRAVSILTDLGLYLGRTFDVGPLRPLHESWLTPYTLPERRRDAGSINRAFLGWLDRRAQPARPFFAFLNYYDAHAPYLLPMGAGYRFGLVPRRPSEYIFLTEQWEWVDKLTLRPVYRELARDSCENCIAFLDEQLGVLVRELGPRGALAHTWLIVTSDHGEGMGEHRLFDHGESLYAQEIHVPLVIVPPAGL
jgi:arylsulfatase A-like enzyme